MIQIKNKRTYDGPGEYVGRPSPLGNPFAIGKDGSREEVLEKYEKWLADRLYPSSPQAVEIERLRKIHDSTGVLTLICWCTPLPCHAEIIAYRIPWPKGKAVTLSYD